MRKDVIGSYMELDEEHRLNSSRARSVERITTMETLEPFLRPGLRVLDVGCGTGIYSLLLAEQGAAVTAVDLVPAHIQRLRELAETAGLSIRAFLGNAVELSAFAENSFDLLLCLGPLYHLTEEADQDACIRECIRVTRPGGALAFAYISPYSVFPCVLRGDPDRSSTRLMEKIVGARRIRSDDPDCFWTDNYYYAPRQIESRLCRFGLHIEDHLASDGQSIAFQSVVNAMDDSQFETWLAYHRKTCREPSLLGASNHGLILARKM